MKSTTIILSFLFATSIVFAQNRSINANFEVDMQGWTSGFTGIFESRDTMIEVDGELLKSSTYTEPSVKWSNLFGSMSDRGGISFSGKNQYGSLFLYIQKEVTGLLPNRNYRVTFNMNWLAWLEADASPVLIMLVVTDQESTVVLSLKELHNGTLITERGVSFGTGFSGFIERDVKFAGRLTPNENGHPFLQNVNNFDNAFYANTDDSGRLFLMIGIETENEKIEHIYLNTLRVLLHENGKAREASNVEILPSETKSISHDYVTPVTLPDETKIEIKPSGIMFVPNAENDTVFFESDFNDEIEIVGIYTEDNHLMKIFSFRDPSVDRAFQTTGLVPGTYRIEFVLVDGRVINETFTIK